MALPLKRGRNSMTPAQVSQDANHTVLEVILSRENNGITKPQIRYETKLADTIIAKSINLLKLQNKIKEVTDIRNKRTKLFMGAGFEASKEVTGGEWYTDGKLDVEFVSTLKILCLKSMQKVGVATVEDIAESIERLGVFKGNNIDLNQIHQVLGSLELEGEVEKMSDDGQGRVSSVPIGKICYRTRAKKLEKTNAMASIPCGICPQISLCTPDGIISPITCVYYKRLWLLMSLAKFYLIVYQLYVIEGSTLDEIKIQPPRTPQSKATSAAMEADQSTTTSTSTSTSSSGSCAPMNLLFVEMSVGYDQHGNKEGRTMAPYKDKPPAVRVYTVCDESRYLIVRNVPALGCGDDLFKLFSSYGDVEECKPMDAEDCEPFTDVYWIKFHLVSNARFAKKKLDEFVFLGNRLQVSYAPQFESLSDTKDKLEGRRREVLARLNPTRSKGPPGSIPGVSTEASLVATPSEINYLPNSSQMNCIPQQLNSNQRSSRELVNKPPITQVSSDKDYFESQSMNQTVRLVREKFNKIQSSSEHLQAESASKKPRVDNRRRI